MEVILKHKKAAAAALIGIMGILVFIIANFVVADKVSAYKVTLNEKEVFIAPDKATVKEQVQAFVDTEEKRVGHDVTITCQPIYHMVLVESDQVADEEEIAESLTKNLVLHTEAAQILVNNKPVISLADEATAKQVLKDVKAGLVNCAPGEKVASARIQEKVNVKMATVATSQVVSPEKAKTILQTGDAKPLKYTVKEGDSLWTIARRYDTHVTTIQALNNLQGEDLDLDQELLISSSSPYLTVCSVIQGQKTEVIPCVTRVISTKSSSSRVAQAGKDGEKKVAYQLTKLNGKVVETKILSETILSKPVDRIVYTRRGSGSYTMTASRGGTHIGGMIWPSFGAISSSYGSHRGHTGMDIDSDTGDPIRAAKAGTVVSAGRAPGYGLMVTIDHGNGLKTRYAHCSKILVSVGQSVSQGQTIAKVGSTGNSTGSHLHFEVISGGSFYNPLRYLN